MNYWILMFRPETYELVKRHQTIGVLEAQQRRFSQMKSGDRFVAYVSRERLLDGHGELTSDPFIETTPIFGAGQVYPRRCRVKFLETGGAKDAREILWGLSKFQEMPMKTTPTNYLKCYGGFMELTKKDYDWLLEVIRGTWSPVPKV